MDHLEKNLKHYNLYFEKLHRFASALNIKIVVKSTSFDGYFSPSTRKIVIDPELGEANTIAVLLHELGHAIQCYFGTIVEAKNITTAYEKNKRFRVEYEKEAWINGENLANALHIRLGTWFYEIKKYYVNCHKKTD